MGALDPNGLLAELDWRGLLQDRTPGLEARLASGRPIRVYNGFDPSGPSLHAGHLVPVFGLMHIQRHGGSPVVLVGGGTGMIGDPSGKSAERNLLDRAQVVANTAAIQAQLEHFLDFSPGPTQARVVDNYDWLGTLGLLEFLRDVGKHFTIPYMLAKDSVQARLESGLSFAEFSYMLLQAADFLHLYRTLGVEVQSGGADQWGNITAGLELIRRVEGAPDGGDGGDPAHALSYPLLLGANGQKFGKTAEGTSVWLDPERTSPYAFYQFWLDTDDETVARLIRRFTLLDRPTIEALEAEAAAAPERRLVQRALAIDLTARVHGPDVAARVEQISEAVFSRRLPELGEEILAFAFEQLPHAVVRPEDLAAGPIGLTVAAGLFESNGEARRALSQGGVSVNEERLAGADASLPAPIGGRYLILRGGKKNYRIVRVEPS
ncbi:MAG: tyrosyl-tRNA synthetase [Chloroflexota bacterium]|nr:tyrosyl-tRNA synthetase [Chloroflexota bacterium]